MGWTSYRTTREGLIQDRIASWRDEHGVLRQEVIAYEVVGDVLYTAEQAYDEDGVPTENFIKVTLMESWSDDHEAYKCMSECMGPYYYGCSPNLFRFAPDGERDPQSKAWRNIVRSRLFDGSPGC